MRVTLPEAEPLDQDGTGEPARDEPVRDGRTQGEPIRDGRTRDEPVRDGAAQGGRTQGETVPDGATQGGRTQGETVPGEPSSDAADASPHVHA